MESSVREPCAYVTDHIVEHAEHLLRSDRRLTYTVLLKRLLTGRRHHSPSQRLFVDLSVTGSPGKISEDSLRPQ
ncbi:hypothetical protein BX616_006315 [Lobosporangium transversale]|nr:hypothetical protein BX616_006315 [Lobosporangium transversale]